MDVGADEVIEMLAQLRVIVMVEALHRSVLDGPVHALDLPVDPGMLNPGQALFNAMFLTDSIEDVLEGMPV